MKQKTTLFPFNIKNILIFLIFKKFFEFRVLNKKIKCKIPISFSKRTILSLVINVISRSIYPFRSGTYHKLFYIKKKKNYFSNKVFNLRENYSYFDFIKWNGMACKLYSIFLFPVLFYFWITGSTQNKRNFSLSRIE